MSFRLFIYYCALCGGWAAFVGWALATPVAPAEQIKNAGVKGMFLGMFVALGLSLVDACWNLSLSQFLQIVMRVGVAVLVGIVGGLLGGMLGQLFYGLTTQWPIVSWVFFVFGWTLVGLLVGASVGVFEILFAVITQKNLGFAVRKLIKSTIGGTVGGILGGVLALVIKFAGGIVFANKDPESLMTPTAVGFVALGMCIGLLIGLAQVFLKEAWIKVESGRRAGREVILAKDKTTIGRAEACDIGLFGDNQIEKLHATIVQNGSRYFLEDAQTPGGTFVNDRPVQGRVPLQSGDMIRVGNSVLCFREVQKRGQAAAAAS